MYKIFYDGEYFLWKICVKVGHGLRRSSCEELQNNLNNYNFNRILSFIFKSANELKNFIKYNYLIFTQILSGRLKNVDLERFWNLLKKVQLKVKSIKFKLSQVVTAKLTSLWIKLSVRKSGCIREIFRINSEIDPLGNPWS